MCANQTGGKEVFGVTIEDRTKRCLPLWMRGMCNAALASESSKVNANKGLIGKATNIDYEANTRNMSKQKSSRAQKDSTNFDDNKCHNTQGTLSWDFISDATSRNMRQQRKRKVNKKETLGTNSCLQGKYEMRKRKRVLEGQKSSARKWCKSKPSDIECCCKNLVQSISDDDMELTTEDLMAIATEYVKAHEKERQKVSDKECESDNQPLAGNSARMGLGRTFHNPGDDKIPSSLAKIVSSGSLANSTSNGTAVIASQSGDPAQDMLNLFLGPLLKKPYEEEKMECIAEDNPVTFVSHRDNVGELSGEETVQLTKKKSSLKEKVAFFLD